MLEVITRTIEDYRDEYSIVIKPHIKQVIIQKFFRADPIEYSTLQKVTLTTEQALVVVERLNVFIKNLTKKYTNLILLENDNIKLEASGAVDNYYVTIEFNRNGKCVFHDHIKKDVLFKIIKFLQDELDKYIKYGYSNL
jgi:hypothetical protein